MSEHTDTGVGEYLTGAERRSQRYTPLVKILGSFVAVAALMAPHTVAHATGDQTPRPKRLNTSVTPNKAPTSLDATLGRKPKKLGVYDNSTKFIIQNAKGTRQERCLVLGSLTGVADYPKYTILSVGTDSMYLNESHKPGSTMNVANIDGFNEVVELDFDSSGMVGTREDAAEVAALVFELCDMYADYSGLEEV